MGIALLSSTFLTAQAQCCQKGSCHSEQTSGKDCCTQKGLYTTSYADNPKLVKKAEKWAKKGAWRNGFTKGKPSRQCQPGRFLPAVSEESQAMEGALRIHRQDRSPDDSKGQASDSGL